MAEKHPYMPGSGGLIQTVSQLRKSFPNQVSADTLKKLGIAPNNESYVINILRFVGVLDAEGKKTGPASAVFSKHDDAEFQAGLAGMVKSAYTGLFEIHGDDAWNLPLSKLISFFRSADHTSSIVGQRQATTFQTLASLSGHAAAPVAKSSPATKRAPTAKRAAGKSAPTGEHKKPQKRHVTEARLADAMGHGGGGKGRDVGLTVRIEVNLPAGADQETYDRIFKSMRENLLNG